VRVSRTFERERRESLGKLEKLGKILGIVPVGGATGSDMPPPKFQHPFFQHPFFIFFLPDLPIGG